MEKFIAELIEPLLVESTIKNESSKLVSESAIVDEAKGIKKVVGVYGGRFQPFGLHHKKTFEWLENCLLYTSDAADE